MKRFLLLGAASALALFVVAWARGSGGAPSAPVEPLEVHSVSPAPPPADEGLQAFRPPRNLFEYGGDTRQVRPPPPAAALPAPTPVPGVEPSGEVRLVGVLRRGGEARAALAIRDEVVVLAAGEAASGYTLLAVDEDAGARLRAPSGAEIVAPPAP